MKYVCSTSGTYATVSQFSCLTVSYIDIVCMSSAEICWELLNYNGIIMQWIQQKEKIVNSVHCASVFLYCYVCVSFPFVFVISFLFVGCACCNCYALRPSSPSTIIMYSTLHKQFQETKTTISRVHQRLHAQQLPLYIYLQRRMGKQECPKNRPILRGGLSYPTIALNMTKSTGRPSQSN